MTLDPLAQAFVDRLAASPGPPITQISPDQDRAGFRALIETFDAKGEAIGKVENLTMPGPRSALALRIYTPVAAGGEALPALVYFHGGSFRVGDLDTHDTICRLIAGEAGCRVVAVDYRLAPEHPFPAGLEDCLAAVRWIETHAAKLGVDPNRIAVGGDSAGGNLAAVVCQSSRLQGGPDFVYQLLFFPVTQLGARFPSVHTYATGHLLEKVPLDYCYEQYASRERWDDPRISPLLAKSFTGLPPAYIVLAECDLLHDEGMAYAQKLRAAGVGTVVADYLGMFHGFICFQAVLPQAREAVVAAARALRTAFETA